jgi:hypothetical protein
MVLPGVRAANRCCTARLFAASMFENCTEFNGIGVV